MTAHQISLVLNPAQKLKIAKGLDVGVSDADNRHLSKRAIWISTDAGKLWLKPDSICFQGDVERLEITRDRLLRMERKVYGKNLAAHAGTVHVVLRFKTPEDKERAIRLDCLGCWSLGSTARATDDLAIQIEAWQKAGVSEP